jgi:hypothetical protein
MLVEAINGLEVNCLTQLDTILARLYCEGHQVEAMRMGADAIMHLTHLAEEADAIIQVKARYEGEQVVGVRVTGYKHVMTGEIVRIDPLPEDRERVEFYAIAA